ncbi:MAG: hypothetical protein LQ351_006541 [Letrouitia transgressa]|nr:MAG: hypothetical protein LQ351_006541 [Letrouitia transgressa]
MPPKSRPRQPTRQTSTADDLVQGTVDPERSRDVPAFGEEGQGDSIDADDPSLTNPKSQAVEPGQTASAQPASVSSIPPNRVERLASLNPQQGAIGSATPTHPSVTQTKRVRFQPKVAVRRSKEEREALEKAESERRQARLAASANFGAPASRETRGILKVRGGAFDQRDSERLAGSGASGFLGGASPAEDRRRKLSASSRGRGRSSLLAGTSRDTTKPDESEVQNERAPGKSKDEDGDTVVRGARGRKTRTAVKKEDKKLEHVPSSDEEPFEVQPLGRRVNVEHINLVSDEESPEETKDGGKGKEKEKSTKLSGSSLMRPIRIDRHEHVERTIGVNTDASLLTSAGEAKARGNAKGVFLPANAELKDRKGKKGRSREKDQEVEFLRHEIREPGIDPDKDQNAGPQVKQEPADAGEMTAVGNSDELSATAIVQEVFNQRPQEPALRPKRLAIPRPRRRSRRKLNARKPVLQTDEDRKEWERYQEDVTLIYEELRKVSPLSPPRGPENNSTTDEQDPNSSQEPKGQSKEKDKKDGLVYLFQLPPLMPELQLQLDKSQNLKARRKDSESEAMEPSVSQDKSEAAYAHGSENRDSEPEIKPAIETDPDTNPTIFTPAQSSRMSVGRVGEIMLDKDGFPNAVWGKTKMDVGRASAYGSLQEIILLRTGPRGKVKRMRKAMSENGGKVRVAGSSMGGKPGEAAPGKKGKSSEATPRKKEKPGEAASGKKAKPDETASKKKDKPREATPRKKAESGEAASKKKDKPREVTPRKKERPGEAASGKKAKPDETASEKKDKPKKATSEKKDKPKKATSGKKDKPKEAASKKKDNPKEAASGKKDKPKKATSRKKDQPKKATSKKQDKPREATFGKKRKPSEAASKKKEKPSEAASGNKGKPGAAGSRRKGKTDGVRPGRRKKVGEAGSRKRGREGEVKSKKGGKVGEVRPEKSGKAREVRPRKEEKAGDARSGKRGPRDEARSVKRKGRRLRRARREGWAIGQMGGGFVMVPDWDKVFAQGRGRRKPMTKKNNRKRIKRRKVGERSSEKSQEKATEIDR